MRRLVNLPFNLFTLFTKNSPSRIFFLCISRIRKWAVTVLLLERITWVLAVAIFKFFRSQHLHTRISIYLKSFCCLRPRRPDYLLRPWKEDNSRSSILSYALKINLRGMRVTFLLLKFVYSVSFLDSSVI